MTEPPKRRTKTRPTRPARPARPTRPTRSVRKKSEKKSGEVRSKPEEGKRALGPPTGKAVRALRALGHHLDPVVQIGKEGITDALRKAVDEALLAHELIKVRVGTEAPVERKDAALELSAQTGAFLAQVLGRTFLLYRRHPKKPKIALPR